MVQIVPLWRFLPANSEAVSLAELIELRWHFIGGTARRNHAILGEIRPAAESNAAVSFGERGGAAIGGFLALWVGVEEPPALGEGMGDLGRRVVGEVLADVLVAHQRDLLLHQPIILL